MNTQMLDYLSLLYSATNRYTNVKYTRVGKTWFVTCYDIKTKRVILTQFPVVEVNDDD